MLTFIPGSREARRALPDVSLQSGTLSEWRIQLTAFNRLRDTDRDFALVRIGNHLGLEVCARSTRAAAVHGPLEGVAFPAEQVVSVLTKASPKRVGKQRAWTLGR